MRIQRLELTAFGPFTDAVLDLGGGEQGLHLVHGPNEAGKSSALRALGRFLFGFPGKDTGGADGFLHPLKNLRVAATLRLDSGEPFSAVRRRGNKNTLRGPDDIDPVDENLLQQALHYMEQAQFFTLFGIDHEELRKGGEAMARGEGEVGRLLFGAGAGFTGLRQAQDQLRQDMEALFKPRGSTQRINAAKKEYDDLGRQLNEASLQGERWRELHDALATAGQDKEEIAGRIAGIDRRRLRLERLLKARPHIALRRELLERIGSMGDAVLLRPEFGKELLGFRKDLTTALGEAAKIKTKIETLTKDLEALPASFPLLDHAERIAALHQELGSHLKARQDKPGVAKLLQAARANMRRILAALPGSPGQEDLDRFRLSRAQTLPIEELSTEHGRLAERKLAADKRLADLAPALEQARAEQTSIKPLPGDSDLRMAVRSIRGQGDIESQYRQGLAESEAETRALEDSLARQQVWSGSLADLERLPLPLDESVQQFERTFADLADREKASHSDQDAAARKAQEVAARIQATERSGPLPNEADLAEARQTRDKGWRLARDLWRDNKDVSREIAEFTGRMDMDAPQDLAGAYESSVRRADDLADTLRSEADRVAAHAALLVEQETIEQKAHQTQADMEASARERAALEQDWRELWQASGIAPLTPFEMRGWLQNIRNLAAQAVRSRENRLKVETLAGRINDFQTELRAKLDQVRGEDDSLEPCPDNETLAGCLERCELVLETLDARRARQEQAQSDLRRLQGELDHAEQSRTEVVQALADWRERWTEAVAPLGLGAEASPSQASALLQDARELVGFADEALGFESRIQGMDRDAGDFSRRVANTVGSVAPDLSGDSEEQAVAELMARLNQDRDAHTRQQGLAKLLGEQQEALETARKQEAEARAGLDALCREAGCSEPGGLEQAEQRSLELGEAKRQLARAEDHLREHSQGESFDAFSNEAMDLDPDQANAELNRLDQELEGLKTRHEDVVHAMGGQENELAQMDASARAADLAQEAQSVLAAMENDVERYARVCLADRLLATAVESFREKNQGPLLARSSELFARLTLGSFSGLRLEPGDKGEVLLGVRANNGQALPVSAMSDGSADQLYLAVRLAGLESYMASRGPMPFIVDDVLVNFDDDRAGAALDVLAELSTQTQVVFFTHHQHLMGLAKSRLPSDVIFSHSL